MTSKDQYKSFIESVCHKYGIDKAIKPLQEGLDIFVEAHHDRTTGGNWFGKTIRDQNNFDSKGVTDTKTMGKTSDLYDKRESGVKGMGLSGKFGNAWDLKDDGYGYTGQNSDFTSTGRRIMKRQENEFWNRDVQDQIKDMTTTDYDFVNDLKTAIGDVYARWNEKNDANGQMVSDADFRKYVEDALTELSIGG